jgi:hypothetical protein
MPFLGLAAAGFVLSLVVHACALGGSALIQGQSSWLHSGVFVVWLPATFAASRLARGPGEFSGWHPIFRLWPRWLRRGMALCFAYAVLNLAIFLMVSQLDPNGADVPPGVPVPPWFVRGISAFWMFLYAAAFAVLFSYVVARADEAMDPRAKGRAPVDDWGEVGP